ACPPTHHCLCRTSVVRHYKVKHEGPKYVIDVEEPFSCASLDAVVDYFVSHTNKALVPFLLDEDYEKVLGGCGLRELGGPSTCLSGSCPHGSPLGQCPASAPPLGPLSVLGHVEADKENGESVWVARSTPTAPGPGDAPALRPPLGQSGPAPASGSPKQLPPVPITPVASQDWSAPLLNQEENYVIPIGDDPAANYMNEDVPSRSRPVLNPRKLAKVQAKPLKPPVAPKPGRGSLLPPPFQPRASISLHLFICLLLQSPKASMAAWPRSWQSAQCRLSSPQQVRRVGVDAGGQRCHTGPPLRNAPRSNALLS
uniref:Signal transducing adaptor family member 2 n=1 Tax=Ailuropoda melanoleuca TaxID=9646 RepID=A0A7N5JVJ4_AILME